MRSLMLWCIGLVAVLSACTDDPPAPAIQSQGAGETNAAPLWVPRPGPIGPVRLHSGAPTFAMSEDRMIGGRRVFTAGFPGTVSTLDSDAGPAEAYFKRLYSRQDDGIYLEGDTRHGLYDVPILFVPSTVRVGMRWTHPPRWRFEVIARREGAPTQWDIQVIDGERRITNDSNTAILVGFPYTLTYYEGSPLGPFVNPKEGKTVWLAQDAVPPPEAPPVVPNLALRALNDGEPIATEIVPTFFGAVVDASGDHIDLIIDGRIPQIVNTTAPNAPAFWIIVDGQSCGAYTRSSDKLSDPVDANDLCRDPRGSVFDAQGRLLRIANDRWNRYYYCVPGVSTLGTPTCNPQNFSFAGIFRAENGCVQVLTEGGVARLAPHDGDTTTAMGLYGITFSESWQALFDANIAETLNSRAIWLPEEDATGWNILTVLKDGLMAVHADREGRVDAMTSMRDEGGNLGLSSSPSGRRLLRAHPDGTIERITWQRDGIFRQPLGTVEVATDRVLVGAVEVGERILVLTLHDFRGAQPQYGKGGKAGDVLSGGADRAIKPDLGHLRLWEATLPATNSPPRPAPELTKVYAALDPVSRSDAALCGFTGSPPVAGWTVSGAPALAFKLSPSGCLMAVGDKARDTGLQGRVTGSLPELGAFTLNLALPTSLWDEAFLGDDWFKGAMALADGSGFSACQTRTPPVDTEPDGEGTCVAWRRFDTDWNLVAENLTTAPVLAAHPDPTTCLTAAGATCQIVGGRLLECSGLGAGGPHLLPEAGLSGVGTTSWTTHCWAIQDTLWMQIHRDRGLTQSTFLMRVDTLAWTFDLMPIDASTFSHHEIDPKGDVLLYYDHGTLLVKPGSRDIERFPTSFAAPSGTRVSGPLLYGIAPGDLPATRRIWRPDGPRERLPGCGDGTLDEDEFCPEDVFCQSGESYCEPGSEDGTVLTCDNRGEQWLRHSCSRVCENGSCFDTGEVCVDGGCHRLVACGAMMCAPNETCLANTTCGVLTRCGDGLCESEEVGTTCVDCEEALNAWDGICTFQERWRSDCARCDDGRCQEGENTSCPQDCAGCGDGICGPGERDRCPTDCPSCGNEICERFNPYAENEETCPVDCLPCTPTQSGCFQEGVVTCRPDGLVDALTPCGAAQICVAGACVAGATCGNGRCEGAEVSTCAADCPP